MHSLKMKSENCHAPIDLEQRILSNSLYQDLFYLLSQ